VASSIKDVDRPELPVAQCSHLPDCSVAAHSTTVAEVKSSVANPAAVVVATASGLGCCSADYQAALAAES